MKRNSYLTVTDQFCGAGGSSQGARKLSNKIGGGLEVKLALNHWKLAIETHNTNFPDTDHDCADISGVDPRRYQSTDILITSPECTNHSLAKGTKRKYKQKETLFGNLTIDPSAERSRATMWDVPRFAEFHDYNLIIVENVVEARKWVMWDAWLHAMHNLNYKHKCVYLNSMHMHPVPQSRDRMYVVFWKKGNKAPDLNFTPLAFCSKCTKDVHALQTWKNSRNKFGKYKKQYLYNCPHCGQVVEPYYYSAFNIIDWSIPGLPVLDRKKQLRPNTIKRIQWGLDNFGNKSFMIYLDHSKNNNNGTSIFAPGKTQTTADATGFVTPYIVENYGQSKARNIIEAIGTLKTNTTMGFVSSKAINGWLTYYNGRNQASPILSEPVGTLPTHDRVAIAIHPDKKNLSLEDVLYRTIRPHEVQKGMAFDDNYIVCGNSGEKVKQLGNAVTPPVMEWLLEKGIETLQ